MKKKEIDTDRDRERENIVIEMITNNIYPLNLEDTTPVPLRPILKPLPKEEETEEDVMSKEESKRQLERGTKSEQRDEEKL